MCLAVIAQPPPSNTDISFPFSTGSFRSRSQLTQYAVVILLCREISGNEYKYAYQNGVTFLVSFLAPSNGII